VLVDFEGLRNRSLRYLCGHPADALLFLFPARTGGAEGAGGANGGQGAAGAGESLLVAWDLPLAQRLACVDGGIAYEDYDRSLHQAVTTVLAERGVRSAELSGGLPFPLVQGLQAALPAVEIRCRDGGLDGCLAGAREIKDAEEIACLREACRITDELLALVEDRVRGPRDLSETQVALLLESEARARGAEGMGFETLAAGPGRSFGIHCFPAVTGGPFASTGLSILDFGVCFAGYGSDVTTTVLRGPLRPGQRRMRAAVRRAERAVTPARRRPRRAWLPAW